MVQRKPTSELDEALIFVLQSDADNWRTTVPWDTEFCITTANYVLNTACKTIINKMAALTYVQY